MAILGLALVANGYSLLYDPFAAAEKLAARRTNGTSGGSRAHGGSGSGSGSGAPQDASDAGLQMHTVYDSRSAEAVDPCGTGGLELCERTRNRDRPSSGSYVSLRAEGQPAMGRDQPIELDQLLIVAGGGGGDAGDGVFDGKAND